MANKNSVRDADKGYIDSWLWYPKKFAPEEAVKSSLRFYSKGDYVPLWRETEDHILVPREALPHDQLDFPIEDRRPTFEKVDIKSKIVLDAKNPAETAQRDAFEDLKIADKGILNLACGAGKTVMFLHAIAQWGEPALIINDKEHILHQWKQEISKHLDLEEEIGWVQGKPATWDWKRPITLAMLKSLAKHSENLPEGMSEWFGRIIWDEVHHLSAPTFAKTAVLFPGKRYGATATVNRSDGGEILYFGHVGPIIHSNLNQDIIPTVKFRRSHTSVDLTDKAARRACCDITGEWHYKKTAEFIGTRPEELNLCKEVIQRGLSKGMKILALSSSRAQVTKLHEMFPDSGLIISGDPKKPEDRLDILKNSQLIFATTTIAQEALDEPSLDALVILNEFSDKNLLQQAVGRIQRKPTNGKTKAPKVVVMFHVRVPMLRAMGVNLKRHFRQWGFNEETIG